MNIRVFMGALLCVGLLAGCVTPPQSSVAYKSEALTTKPTKLGIAMTDLPKVDTAFPGASCLLCFAAASMANSSLTTYAGTLNHDDLNGLKEQIAEVLGKKGITTVIVRESIDVNGLPDGTTGPDLARKDFRSFKTKYGVDKLLVVAFSSIGFTRSYSSYFPISDPRASLVGAAYIVDLTSNKYDWYKPISQFTAAEGKWDEPPKFPGLTNAYFQAIELTKDGIVSPLSK